MDSAEPPRGLQTFDAFPKVKPAYAVPTKRGSFVTAVLGVFALFFIWQQSAYYFHGNEHYQFDVNSAVDTQMQINLDMTVHMPCVALRVHAQDSTMDTLFATEVLKMEPAVYEEGERNHHDIKNQKKKDTYDRVLSNARLNKFKPRRIKNSHIEPDACRIYGSFPVNKVKGDLHITPLGYAYHSIMHAPLETINLTHYIDELSFGDYYPKLENPLDGVLATTQSHATIYQYFVSILPTTYSVSRSGYKINTNQYAVTERVSEQQEFKSQQPLGIFIKYDISGLSLTITDKRSSFLSFILKLINVLTGIFIISGWGLSVYEKLQKDRKSSTGYIGVEEIEKKS